MYSQPESSVYKSSIYMMYLGIFMIFFSEKFICDLVGQIVYGPYIKTEREENQSLDKAVNTVL